MLVWLWYSILFIRTNQMKLLGKCLDEVWCWTHRHIVNLWRVNVPRFARNKITSHIWICMQIVLLGVEFIFDMVWGASFDQIMVQTWKWIPQWQNVILSAQCSFSCFSVSLSLFFRRLSILQWKMFLSPCSLPFCALYYSGPPRTKSN